MLFHTHIRFIKLRVIYQIIKYFVFNICYIKLRIMLCRMAGSTGIEPAAFRVTTTSNALLGPHHLPFTEQYLLSKY